MTDRRDRDPGSPEDPLEDLLCEILDRLDAGAELEEILAQHPEQAPLLRRRIEQLRAIGLERVNVETPEKLGPYRLLSLIGRGGMGEVWLARHDELDREIALKLMGGSFSSPGIEKRFRREAMALARLDDPHIVRVHDAGLLSGRAYIAMEHVPGRSMAEILRAGPVDTKRALRWAIEIGRALGVAHGAGLIHRDVKPGNIQIRPDDSAVLIDFGLTRGVGIDSMSATGSFVGSPHYASPEQVSGKRDEIGPASDIYSLGVTLYECVTGRLPFNSATPEGLFRTILGDDPRAPRRIVSGLSRDLERTILQAMEKRPRDRQSSASALVADLESVRDGRALGRGYAPDARRLMRLAGRHPIVVTAVFAVIVAAIVWTGSRLYEAREDAIARREEATKELALAENELETFLANSADLPERIAAFDHRSRLFESSPAKAEDLAALNAELRHIESASTGAEIAFARITESLLRATDLDPEVEGARRLRARMYLERWRLARARSSTKEAEFFAQLVRENDDRGDLAAMVVPTHRLSLVTSQPGVRVDAFVFRRHDDLVSGGDPRLVPVPWRGAETDLIGRHLLRVRHATAGLEPEDLILEVAGRPVSGTVFVAEDRAALRKGDQLLAIGEAAVQDVGAAELLLAEARQQTLRVLRGERELALLMPGDEVPGLRDAREWAENEVVDLLVRRDGELFRARSGPGLILRPTAAPLLTGPESFVGTTPLEDVPIDGERLVLLLRLPGHEPQRLPWPPYDPGAARPVMRPTGRHPPEFIDAWSQMSDHQLVMDREVSCAEYLDFLRSVDGRRIMAEDPHRLLPRDPRPWPLADSGEVSLPPELRADHPIHGISWSDAMTYAAWRSERAADDGRDFRFALPEQDRWRAAVQCDARSRRFPWGEHFRGPWVKSCFSRSEPLIEPGLRFPIDETITGLLDTVGSVSEYCRGWFWKERGERPALGGAWVYADPLRFETRFTHGVNPDAAAEYRGFRLMLIDHDRR